MKIQIEIDADVRHLHSVLTLCSVFDAYRKPMPEGGADDLDADLAPALYSLFILLHQAPEGYSGTSNIENWSEEGGNITPRLIELLRKVADRMEKAIHQ